MSNITVRKSAGDILEVTLLTLFGMLADEHSHCDVTYRLNREQHLQVELKDGTATIWRTSPSSAAAPSKALVPLNPYTVHASLHFSIPAQIHCSAGSPAEASHLAQETVHGHRGVPSDFKIEFDQDDIEAFFGNLEIGSYALVDKVTVNSVQPCLLITREALS
jgi:hypothetical protein